MILDEIVAAQKRGEARGIASICSAQPYVLKQALKSFEFPLIEATCNQVNQFGGYTGMTPAGFASYVGEIAKESNFCCDNILLGGDHLGPSAWQDEPADEAMQKAQVLIHDYVEAGFVKIHLDCSMRLGDDPEGPLNMERSAYRAASLARMAEKAGNPALRYVIGTEVPSPGGAMESGESTHVTKVEDVRESIEIHREAFYSLGLHSAWDRVIAIVVQPGVEFGDTFVLPYQHHLARELSVFIKTQAMVYEAHSTDYQTGQALREMVQDQFAILKVGPALTFAFREAVFALAMVENELFSADERSDIIAVLEEVMVEKPEHWVKYYHGDEKEKAFKRKYSLSDRMRYYWANPSVQQAFEKMMTNLRQIPWPGTLLKQYLPQYGLDLTPTISSTASLTPEDILSSKIRNVMDGYIQACGLE